MSTCASCGAGIEWRRNARTNKLAPIDVEPDPKGNVVLTPEGRYRVLTAVELRENTDAVRYQAHFASCPSSGQHRRRRIPGG